MLRAVITVKYVPRSGKPQPTRAGRAATILFLVLVVPTTLLLAVVTMLLVVGLMTDPTGFKGQIPAMVIGLVMSVGGGILSYRSVRRLARGSD